MPKDTDDNYRRVSLIRSFSVPPERRYMRKKRTWLHEMRIGVSAYERDRCSICLNDCHLDAEGGGLISHLPAHVSNAKRLGTSRALTAQPCPPDYRPREASPHRGRRVSQKASAPCSSIYRARSPSRRSSAPSPRPSRTGGDPSTADGHP